MTLAHNTFRTLFALSVAALLASSPAAAGTTFSEISVAAGVAHHHESGFLAPIGAGAAWADFDGDGDDDLYTVQGTGCNRFYRNEGQGTFTEIADAAGAAACEDVSHGIGVADFDNDGDQDLFLSNYGQNRLFRNDANGGANFVEITATAGMDGDGARNSASAVWGDFDADGHLDLFVGNHTEFPIEGDVPTCYPDHLWHNQGDGTFIDIGPDTGIHLSGVLLKAGCALAAAWSDFDNDGDADLFVINDFGPTNEVPDRVFRNDGPGESAWVFTDVTEQAQFGELHAGMGIAIADIDHDGWLDYYVSDLGDNELAHNRGDGSFDEIAASAGVLANDFDIYGGWGGLVSWGNGFHDLDNDGWEDLVVVHGGAPNDKWPAMFGLDYVDDNPPYIYFNNRDLGFSEQHVEAGISTAAMYRTVAATDFDADGDVDLYLGNLQGDNRLYRNDAADGNSWLQVRVRGTVGNRDGIGARVEALTGATRLLREVNGGSGFLSRNGLTVHFGLERARKVDQLTVRFPSGLRQRFLDVSSNQVLEVIEPVVTTALPQERFLTVPGGMLALQLSLQNETTEPQTGQVWADFRAPGGAPTPLFGPLERPLAGGELAERTFNVNFGPDLPANIYRVTLYYGSFPGTIIHRDYAWVAVRNGLATDGHIQ